MASGPEPEVRSAGRCIKEPSEISQIGRNWSADHGPEGPQDAECVCEFTYNIWPHENGFSTVFTIVPIHMVAAI